MTSLGRLVVVEGPDGVGKSTLTLALAARLREVGLPCNTYAFPGNEPGTLGSLVYQLHHEREILGVREVAPVAIQAMHIAAHLDAIERVFRPRVEAGETFVLDRYWWSTAVYGAVSGIRPEVLDDLINAERRCWGDLRPLVVFLIDQARPWRASEDAVIWHRLAQGYRRLASNERARCNVVVIANDGDPEQVAGRMAETVLSLIRRSDPVVDHVPAGSQLHLGLTGESPTQPTSKVPLAVGRIRGLRPTEVFDTYWRFAVKRQDAFFRRLEGTPPPWSADLILQRHRFTNVYRASDRVSQFLIRHVLYQGDQEASEIFFRAILFKLFNRIETWDLLKRSFGEPTVADFQPARYEQVLDRAMKAGQPIYSAAYIMPAAPNGRGQAKHAGHLRLLQRMINDDLPQRIADARSLQQAFELLRAYPMMGDFLAFQYVIDLNYSNLITFSEMEFVVPGPGAKSGLRKCFLDSAGLSDADLIRLVTESQHEEFARRGLAFRDLWGRSLQLIDCQNLFCEVDKYARVAHPEVTGGSERTRIKQVFRPAGRPTQPWYPPKWGLNESIRSSLERANAPDRS